jgi:signal peptidase I
VIKWLLVLIVVAVGATVLRTSVVQPFSVPSSAMLPTLQPGDRILVVKSSRLAGPVRSGDIVVFRRPAYFPCSAQKGNKSQDLVQRVVAVPGETIWSKGNRIYVNGRLLAEHGWFDKKFGQVGPAPILFTKVPAGKYYVMGDNRSDSCDSRAFGTIPRVSIVGKVFAVVVRHSHLFVRFF